MSLFTPTNRTLSKRKSRSVKAVTALRSLTVVAGFLAHTACQEDFIRPNLVLIALERTRVDHVNGYGGAWTRTPLFDHLARRGLRFTNAYTSTSEGGDATLDLLSGGNPAEKRPLLPEILQRDGYVTIGSLNVRGASDPRLKVGFDELDDAGGTHEERSDRLFKLVTSHVLDEKPIFVFYQAPVVEAPYRNASERTAAGERKVPDVDFELLQESLASGEPLDEEAAIWLADLYAMEIGRTHDTLAGFMAPLRGWGFFNRYLTVATALAGEELGEHGRYSPADYLYDEVLQIPLIMASDNMMDSAIRPELVTIRDIAPTLLGYADITSDADMAGRDLLSPEQSPREAVRSRARDQRAVRTTEWKLIESTDGETVELYNLVDDPREQTNVAAEHPDVVEQLRAR
jgi:N-sulfoglucosamine sulfohydrolase